MILAPFDPPALSAARRQEDRIRILAIAQVLRMVFLWWMGGSCVKPRPPPDRRESPAIAEGVLPYFLNADLSAPQVLVLIAGDPGSKAEFFSALGGVCATRVPQTLPPTSA